MQKVSVLILFFVALLNVPFAYANKDNVLYVQLQSTGEHLHVKANLDNDVIAFEVSDALTQLEADFGQLWGELDTWQVNKKNVAHLVSQYEASLLTPLNRLLENAKQVHFIIDETSFDYALGLIPYRGQPLFLQYPISYSTDNVKVLTKSYYSENWRGLSISDETADPDNAAAFIGSFLTRSEHYKMEEVNYSQFKQFEAKDLLVFSLHGVKTDASAIMTLNEESITAEDFAHFNSQLIYLDSCQMGASLNFANGLKNYGNEFLIAPLFSNEAGGSSSETINGFFSHLKAGHSPAVAMFKVRKALFEKYSQAQNPDDAYWKAFPFRVYQQI
ncbi:CHAT domain-containing protein [Catenovulum sp. SM1970]|uniref:CHAT domain-containing protein n=1 Tax=Marinifaba aquimaris TaxID=2741323 RepID=UPI0015745895|nr:CHAT domain-containing protein [Marinifaba aquimaris]NTS78483.1 CHAT domain-containing protein [Marinifaba aquimaris]